MDIAMVALCCVLVLIASLLAVIGLFGVLPVFIRFAFEEWREFIDDWRRGRR